MHGFTAAILLMTTALLGACRSEVDQRTALVEAGVEECVRSFESSAAERPGMVPEGYDSRRICTCSWQGVSKDRGLDELRAIRRSDEASPALLEAIGGCLAEEGRRAGLLSKGAE